MCRVDVPVTFINEDKMLFLLFDIELEGSFKGTGSIWRSEGALMVRLMFVFVFVDFEFWTPEFDMDVSMSRCP